MSAQGYQGMLNRWRVSTDDHKRAFAEFMDAERHERSAELHVAMNAISAFRTGANLPAPLADSIREFEEARKARNRAEGVLEFLSRGIPNQPNRSE